MKHSVNKKSEEVRDACMSLDPCAQKVVHRQVMEGDASSKRFERLHYSDGSTKILLSMANHTARERQGFLRGAGFLQEACCLSAPRLYWHDQEKGLFLLEDFGTQNLLGFLLKRPESTAMAYRNAIDTLLTFQKGEAQPDTFRRYQTDDFVAQGMQWIDWYLPFFSGIANAHFKEQFEQYLREALESLPELPVVPVHGDYHSPNLFYLSERQNSRKIGIIDFQDMMMGSPAFDLVSLVEDARYSLSIEEIKYWSMYYLKNYGYDLQPEEFFRHFHLFGLVRNAKILGFIVQKIKKYGNRQYVNMLPRVKRYLSYNIAFFQGGALSHYMRRFL